VLLLSAVLSAPWHELTAVATILGLAGLAGAVYVVIVAQRFRRQPTYHPQFQDWLFHVLLPFAAYLLLAASACAIRSHMRALFAVAASALLLLFIGIHNAWDSVTYAVFVRKREGK
jgi:hypothetical protein